MSVHRTLWVINNTFLLLFTLMAAAATVIAVHEIFFSLPECPGGAQDCMMRHGHWEGGKLVGLILAGAWLVDMGWWVATRSFPRHGTTPLWLAPLWLLPLFVLANLLPMFS